MFLRVFFEKSLTTGQRRKTTQPQAHLPYRVCHLRFTLPLPTHATRPSSRSYLFRQLSRRSKLYTEMYVDQTLLHQQGNLHNFLSNRAEDGPVAVQVCLRSVVFSVSQLSSRTHQL